MIKKLLLASCIVMGAQAHVPRFPLEDQVVDLYLEVEPQVNRIYIQKLSQEYMIWAHSVEDEVSCKADVVYIMRMSNMMGEIMLAYHYGL